MVTQENGWIDPKSGSREHLALKYLNLPESEWIQMNGRSEPGEQEQRRRKPLLLPDPAMLVSKAEQLLQMKSWPEVVVGLGLVTGRGLGEILKTGQFSEKSVSSASSASSAYAVWFAGPMTIAEQMCEPFEVPTLVHASTVMEALHRVRAFFGSHFRWVERRDISRQCSEAVRDAIYRHLLGLMPIRPGESNLYTFFRVAEEACGLERGYCWLECV